jgi:hypothetical protein
MSFVAMSFLLALAAPALAGTEYFEAYWPQEGGNGSKAGGCSYQIPLADLADQADEASCAVLDVCWVWEYGTVPAGFSTPYFGEKCNASSSLWMPVANVSDGLDGFWVCPEIFALGHVVCTTEEPRVDEREDDRAEPAPPPREEACSGLALFGIDCDHDGNPSGSVELCVDDYGVGDEGPEGLCTGTAALPLLTSPGDTWPVVDCDDTEPEVGTIPTGYVCADEDGDGYIGGMWGGFEICPPAGVDTEPCTYGAAWDCDDTDAGSTPETWCVDADGDGFGSDDCAVQCPTEDHAGRVSNDLDCNDTDASLHPGTYWMGDPDGDEHFTLIGMGCPLGDVLIAPCVDGATPACEGLGAPSCDLVPDVGPELDVCAYGVSDLVLLDL